LAKLDAGFARLTDDRRFGVRSASIAAIDSPRRAPWPSATPAAYAHGLALALPDAVMARPTGVGRALTTYEIPIEGRDEWIAAANRLA
jgi:hypothetical protein